MFRITRSEDTAGTVLTLDGDLSRDSVETVEQCCRQALAAGGPVELVLNEVSNIDLEGRALLSKLASLGVHLRGDGVFTSYLLREMHLAEPTRPQPPVLE